MTLSRWYNVKMSAVMCVVVWLLYLHTSIEGCGGLCFYDESLVYAYSVVFAGGGWVDVKAVSGSNRGFCVFVCLWVKGRRGDKVVRILCLTKISCKSIVPAYEQLYHTCRSSCLKFEDNDPMSCCFIKNGNLKVRTLTDSHRQYAATLFFFLTQCALVSDI